ncbi:InlB B-repeat-containing protein [Bifidobacterium sp. ESL0769]|uniref:InlB B-repeat-containing protein n=1 Tax=Bifidobacterium sp. ESL0769 TaxID=2983229 RepID=UPI0023F7DEC5|nr:InlB B-repeat-containing protein [Bifidobacterium sp. ESL0769]WEV67295.1 InlB B-repeat-containing protein [Bifidobacterium sp. ESL0769]
MNKHISSLRHSQAASGRRSLLTLAAAGLAALAMLAPSSAQAIEPRTCTPGTSSIASCFPDPNLASTVALKVGKSTTATFTTADQNAITSLTHNSQYNISTKIDSLEGIQNLPHLTDLDVTGNNIDSLAPLAGMTQLTSLNIDDNLNRDLTPLAGLTNLTYLSLRHNSVTSLAPLSGHTALTTLIVDQNHISDLTPLAGLTNITDFEAHNEQFDVTPALPKNATTGTLTVAKDPAGNWIEPHDYEPTTGHTYNSSTGQVTWTGLTVHTPRISLLFDHEITLNGRSFIYTGSSTQLKDTENWDVTFDANGGSFTSSGIQYNQSREEVVDGNKATEPNPMPTRPGYTFEGWTSDAAGNNAFDLDNTAITGNKTLYAKWKVNHYTVHFDSNGGSAVPDQSGLTYNSHATKPTSPTRPGYDFEGWETIDGSGNHADFDFNTSITGDTVLHAKWKAHQNTVHFDTGGGSTLPDQTVTSGNTIDNSKKPTKPGQHFDGWQIDDGHGHLVDFNPSTPITGNITLHAKWSTPGANGANGNGANANNGKKGAGQLAETGSVVIPIAVAAAVLLLAGAAITIVVRSKKHNA